MLGFITTVVLLLAFATGASVFDTITGFINHVKVEFTYE